MMLRQARPGRTRRGIALVLVLWVLVLLSVIAGSFVYSVRNNTRLAANMLDSARARALADAGVERGAFELLKPTADLTRWLPDGARHAMALGNARIEVTLDDEAGRIDLNTAPPALLTSLLQSVGVAPDRASQLAQTLVEWRAATAPAGAATVTALHGPLTSLDALQAVPGITPALYRRLAPLVTVYSGEAGVNTALAPAGVLLALPGIDPALVRSYVEQRRALRAAHQPVPALAQAGAYGGDAVSGAFRIRAVAQLRDGMRFARVAVVRVLGNRSAPLRFLSWREADLAPVAAPGQTPG